MPRGLPLAAAAAAALACATLPACESRFEEGPDPCRPRTRVQVDSFVDGDTVDVTVLDGDFEGRQERVRLTGVDAPEVDHGDPARSDCWGEEAWAEARRVLEGEEGVLTFDTECTDAYERTLAYLWRRSDALFLNQHLVEEGWARACPFPEDDPPNDAFTARFDELQAEAQAAQRGLWGEPCWGEGSCFGS